MQYLNPHNVHPIVLLSRIRPLDTTAQARVFDRINDFGETIHIVVIESSLDVTLINGLVSTPTTPTESSLLQLVINSAGNFDSLPDWSTWTAQEANDYVTSNILNGWNQAQVDSYIDTNVTSLAGARTAFKQIGAAIISIRTIMTFMAKAVVYLRDYTLRLRR